MFEKKNYIYAVYKEKSFTAAAEKLYVSQPCLSAAIKKTEQLIGAPLFERSAKGVTPTKLGYAYLACAEKMMELERSFSDLLEDVNHLHAGSIRIGGSNYVCSYILPVIVNDFSAQYPNIEISICESSSVELEKMLRGDQLDLVIDSYDTKDEHFVYTALTAEKILLAVPSACACNRQSVAFSAKAEDIYYGRVEGASLPLIDLDRFRDEKFILLKNGNSMYKHAMGAFAACDFQPVVSFRLDQLSTSFRLTASGNGLSFVPDTMFKTHLYRENVLLYHVSGAGERTLYAVQKQSSCASVVIRRFTEIAGEVMRNLTTRERRE